MAPETLDILFEKSMPKANDVSNAVDDDLDDDLVDSLEESRKISIFDKEYIMEGEM